MRILNQDEIVRFIDSLGYTLNVDNLVAISGDVREKVAVNFPQVFDLNTLDDVRNFIDMHYSNLCIMIAAALALNCKSDPFASFPPSLELKDTDSVIAYFILSEEKYNALGMSYAESLSILVDKGYTKEDIQSIWNVIPGYAKRTMSKVEAILKYAPTWHTVKYLTTCSYDTNRVNSDLRLIADYVYDYVQQGNYYGITPSTATECNSMIFDIAKKHPWWHESLHQNDTICILAYDYIISKNQLTMSESDIVSILNWYLKNVGWNGNKLSDYKMQLSAIISMCWANPRYVKGTNYTKQEALRLAYESAILSLE